MKNSDDPLMADIKSVLEKQNHFDSVSEITIYSNQCVIVTMPPVNEAAIISIANEFADCGMNAKLEQDGKELESALATLQKFTGMEIK